MKRIVILGILLFCAGIVLSLIAERANDAIAKNGINWAKDKAEFEIKEAKSSARQISAETSWKVMHKSAQDDGGLVVSLSAKRGDFNSRRIWLRIYKTHHFLDEFEALAIDQEIRFISLPCLDEAWRGMKESYLAPENKRTVQYFADHYGE